MKKTKHHRRPRVLGGNGEKRNISIVPDHLHKAYHLLFGEGNPHRIAYLLNEYYIDPDYEVVIRRRE